MARTTVTVMAALALLLPACGDATSGGGALLVVATTSIWGDVATAVLGDEGAVEVLIPVGADPHDFTVSARQAALIQDADLVLANGLGLEAGLTDVLAAAADATTVLELAPLLDPLPLRDGGSPDPHVWMDPQRVVVAAGLVAGELDGIAPGDWTARARAYAARLEAVDGEIRAILDAVPPDRRKLVTNHDALGYLAAAYGFEVVGVVIPGGSTLGEPSSAGLAELVATIRAEGVPAIFAETVEPSLLAEAVAAEVPGVEVVELYSGSLGEPGSGADTLADMLVTDARRIAAALS